MRGRIRRGVAGRAEPYKLKCLGTPEGRVIPGDGLKPVSLQIGDHFPLLVNRGEDDPLHGPPYGLGMPYHPLKYLRPFIAGVHGRIGDVVTLVAVHDKKLSTPAV